MAHKAEKSRLDKLAGDRISTELIVEEMRAKIQLAEFEQKATYEKCEQEKAANMQTLMSERAKNKIRRASMFTDCKQSLRNIPDSHNIKLAFENKPDADKHYIVRKKMTEALTVQDNKVCDIIKRYNLKVHEKEAKQKNVENLENELLLLQKQLTQRGQEQLQSTETQKIRLLENNVEKLKMKLSSAQLITKYYNKIVDVLKEEIQNYPWKLDILESEVINHHKALEEARSVNQESLNLMEKSIQATKEFHDEYFESKKSRDKLLAATRKDVDRVHREVKGSIEKPKQVRPTLLASTPQQESVIKESDDNQIIQMKYETQRKKRLEFENTASVLKNACKVSSKTEILPAITQQHEVQKSLSLQLDSLEDQKVVLEIEKKGVAKEYKNLKYYGEKKLSDGMRIIEKENDTLKKLKSKLKDTVDDIKKKEDLLKNLELGVHNFFLLLTKYKIDQGAQKQMTGVAEKDYEILTRKFEILHEQVQQHGKVSEFLENSEFLDFMEDTLPKTNVRVDTRGDEEDGGDVFEDEGKMSSSIMSREDVKRASQKIVEKNMGKLRRKKK